VARPGAIAAALRFGGRYIVLNGPVTQLNAFTWLAGPSS